jgi:hypothetical protein
VAVGSSGQGGQSVEAIGSLSIEDAGLMAEVEAARRRQRAAEARSFAGCHHQPRGCPSCRHQRSAAGLRQRLRAVVRPVRTQTAERRNATEPVPAEEAKRAEAEQNRLRHTLVAI